MVHKDIRNHSASQEASVQEETANVLHPGLCQFWTPDPLGYSQPDDDCLDLVQSPHVLPIPRFGPTPRLGI